MGRLQTLKPRLATLDTRRIAIAAGTDRIRGSALQVIRDRILRRDHGLCQCDDCRRTQAVKVAHEVEHYRPLWAGGTEDDGNRYAINASCHEEKTACEARMRAAGGWLATPCNCRRHERA